MNILFYTPVNFRCRDIESLAAKFIARGDNVFFTTQCPPGVFHAAMSKIGAKTSVLDSSTGTSMTDVLRRVNKLIRFCRQNNIDVCFSHLEPTNFVSVIAQPFLRTEFIIYRHHVDEAKLNHFEKSISYLLTYKLAKHIICVSERAKEFMIREEDVAPKKISQINLGYDFRLYASPDLQEANNIKKKYAKGILLLSAGRLTKYKRPDLSLELLKKACEANIDCSIIFLGVGEMEPELRKRAEDYAISDRVTFVGYTHQILDYMAAADLLLHPSILESSCVVVKEASLVELPVLICADVGDFNDYMKDGVNGAVVSRDNFVDEGLQKLKDFVHNPTSYKNTGIALRREIMSRFDIDNVFPQYEKLLGL